VRASAARAAAADGDGSEPATINLEVTPQIVATTWQGAADTSWYDAGAPEVSYVLTTDTELAGLADLVNGNLAVDFTGVTITLENDISLEGSAWVPIGTPAKPFKGIFDGEGHTISGLSISNGSGVANALFGVIEDAEVINLTVSGSVSAQSGAVAGIVARAQGSLIENCTSQVSVTGNGSYTGGVAGFVESSTTITGCLNEGVIEGVGSGVTGGIAGGISASEVISSASSAEVSSASGYAGGIVGRVTSSVLRAVYTTGEVTTASGQAGGIAATIGGSGSSIEYSYTIAEVKTTGSGTVGAIVGSVGAGVIFSDVLYLQGALPVSGSGTITATELSEADLKAAASPGGVLATFFVPAPDNTNAGFPLLAWQKTDGGTPGEGEPRDLLADAIAQALATREGVVASTEDGVDVASGIWWTTPGAIAAFEQALLDAQAVFEDATATDQQMRDAVLTLIQATVDFNDCVFDGKKTERSSLSDALTSATDMLLGIVTSTDGTDVDPAWVWATPEDIAALQQAIADANTVFSDEHATQQQLDDALLAIEDATQAFAATKQTGRGENLVAKIPLKEAIAEGQRLVLDILPSTDGRDVAQGTRYVSPDDLALFEQALATAQTTDVFSGATQAEIEAATSALEQALTTFTGSFKTATVERASLSGKVIESVTLFSSVITSADGKDVAPTSRWAKSADILTYTYAIASARAVLDNASSTQNQIDEALRVLNDATTTFSGKIANGTQASNSTTGNTTSSTTSTNRPTVSGSSGSTGTTSGTSRSSTTADEDADEADDADTDEESTDDKDSGTTGSDEDSDDNSSGSRDLPDTQTPLASEGDLSTATPPGTGGADWILPFTLGCAAMLLIGGGGAGAYTLGVRRAKKEAMEALTRDE
jgi:hypothetical protein